MREYPSIGRATGEAMRRNAERAAAAADRPRPPWWPTAEQKRHADAGCGHPDTCNLDPDPDTTEG